MFSERLTFVQTVTLSCEHVTFKSSKHSHLGYCVSSARCLLLFFTSSAAVLISNKGRIRANLRRVETLPARRPPKNKPTSTHRTLGSPHPHQRPSRTPSPALPLTPRPPATRSSPPVTNVSQPRHSRRATCSYPPTAQHPPLCNVDDCTSPAFEESATLRNPDAINPSTVPFPPRATPRCTLDADHLNRRLDDNRPPPNRDSSDSRFCPPRRHPHHPPHTQWPCSPQNRRTRRPLSARRHNPLPSTTPVCRATGITARRHVQTPRSLHHPPSRSFRTTMMPPTPSGKDDL
jgi:hypothetical protein